MQMADNGASSTILVVEDEPLIRITTASALSDAGLTVLDCANADQAITILEQRSDICLVFTDVDMPGSMDGIKLCNYIRDRWPPIALIVTSGKHMSSQPTLPANTPFFAKPYGFEDVIRSIRAFISQSV